MNNVLLVNKVFDNQRISEGVYNLVVKIEELKDTIKMWRRRAEGRKQLARMNPRMLKDIGLTITEVNEEINKPFWR